MRQFLWGVIFGLVFWYGYEKVDPPAILDYLNSATDYAVKSTSGYGGREHR